MKKNWMTRIAACLVCMLTVLGCLSVSALAEDSAGSIMDKIVAGSVSGGTDNTEETSEPTETTGATEENQYLTTTCLEGELSDGSKLEIGGVLPAAADVEAETVDSAVAAELGGGAAESIDAYVVKVIDSDNTCWQPETGEKVRLTLPITVAHNGTVDITHYLEDSEKIRERLAAGTVEVVDLTGAGAAVMGALDGAIQGYRAASGDAAATKVAVERFGNVAVVDGYATIEVESFSVFTATGEIKYGWGGVNDGETYFVRPGEVMEFHVNNGSQLTLTDSAGIVTYTANNLWNGYVQYIFKVSAQAQPGASFSIAFTAVGDTQAKTVHFTVQYITGNDVYIAIMDDHTRTDFPSEPNTINAAYDFWTGDALVEYSKGSDMRFSSDGGSLIKLEQFYKNAKLLTNGATQYTIYGIVDNSGANTVLNYTNIPEEEFTELLAAYCSARSINASDYKLVAYVLKFQLPGQSDTPGWHIDCKAVLKQNYILSYEYNPPASFAVADIKDYSAMPNNQTVREGDTATVGNGSALRLENTTSGVTRTARFVGWNTAPDGSGTTYAAGAAITLTKDTALYAMWQEDTYSITYRSEGQEEVTRDNLIPGTQLTVAAAPSREHYTFDGWKCSTDNASYSPGSNYTMPNRDVIMEAQWTPYSYTVRFHGNGDSSNTMADQAFTYFEEKSLSENEFTRQGYHFAGWAVTAEGGVVYTDGQSVKELSEVNGGVVDLYAVWEHNRVSLTITSVTEDADQNFLYQIRGQALDSEETVILTVALDQKDSKTVVDLPAGTYTVADQSGWAWRYGVSSQSVTIYEGNQTVTFRYGREAAENTAGMTNQWWLNGYGYLWTYRGQSTEGGGAE